MKDSIVLTNSFANYSWFDGCDAYVRRSLALKDVYVKKARKIIRTFKGAAKQKDLTTVAVHIRRGDRASERLYKLGYRVPETSYFIKAMNYFRKRHKNIIFIITTDDRDWVMETFPRERFPNVYLAPENNFEVDFALLTQCNYVIQSVGSFSRWAAYLNGNESVHYRYSMICEPPKCNPKKYKGQQSPFQKHWRTMVN